MSIPLLCAFFLLSPASSSSLGNGTCTSIAHKLAHRCASGGEPVAQRERMPALVEEVSTVSVAAVRVENLSKEYRALARRRTAPYETL